MKAIVYGILPVLIIGLAVQYVYVMKLRHEVFKLRKETFGLRLKIKELPIDKLNFIIQEQQYLSNELSVERDGRLNDELRSVLQNP